VSLDDVERILDIAVAMPRHLLSRRDLEFADAEAGPLGMINQQPYSGGGGGPQVRALRAVRLSTALAVDVRCLALRASRPRVPKARYTKQRAFRQSADASQLRVSLTRPRREAVRRTTKSSAMVATWLGKYLRSLSLRQLVTPTRPHLRQ
jgi:hypothetical protein